MRIFITSTPDELEPHQAAACDVVAELGHQPLLRDPTRGRGLKPVPACARQVRSADAVLALVGGIIESLSGCSGSDQRGVPRGSTCTPGAAEP